MNCILAHTQARGKRKYIVRFEKCILCFDIGLSPSGLTLYHARTNVHAGTLIYWYNAHNEFWLISNNVNSYMEFRAMLKRRDIVSIFGLAIS